MTVNELITELQMLVTQGHGEDTVTSTDKDYELCSDIKILPMTGYYWSEAKGWTIDAKAILVIAWKD